MSITGRLRLGAGLQRVPLILQTEAAECGLACLAMVAGAHGLATDLPTLRQRFSLSLKGVTLADLVAWPTRCSSIHARCAPNWTNSTSCSCLASCTGT